MLWRYGAHSIIASDSFDFPLLFLAPPAAGTDPKPDDDKKSAATKNTTGKKNSEKAVNGNSKGLFGRLLGTIGIKVSAQAHLPEDKDQSIVWDEKTKVCFCSVGISAGGIL